MSENGGRRNITVKLGKVKGITCRANTMKDFMHTIRKQCEERVHNYEFNNFKLP
jgi:hypothetical protein